MQFRPGGEPIPHAEYLAAHAALIGTERWIIDGFGTEETLWQRFAAADTLIHVDLPLAQHYWWVTKRLAKGLFADPPGWPEGSPLWSGSLQSYRVISACHREMTPKYRALAARDDGSQQLHRLRSPLPRSVLSSRRQRCNSGSKLFDRHRRARRLLKAIWFPASQV
ncbi:MAG: adenylate kinase [Proteobacteria bacterium]|nr:adenylate kinase [Pseudomonadota bacterium]